MKMDADLKKIERRAFLTFFRDGLWDICLGLFVIGWGVGLVTEYGAFAGVWLMGLYFLVFGIKQRWIVRRIGYVKMNAVTKKVRWRFVLLLGITFLAGIAAFLLFSNNARPDWLEDYFPLLFNIMLGGLVSLIAAWMSLKRYYLYALLIILGGVVHVWLGIEWAYGFFAAGGIITIWGIVLLITFLKKYPTIESGKLDGGI